VDAASFGVDIAANKAMDGVGIDLHTDDKAKSEGSGATALIFNMFRQGKTYFGTLVDYMRTDMLESNQAKIHVKTRTLVFLFIYTEVNGNFLYFLSLLRRRASGVQI
jgi:hypothetical protein